MYLSNTSLLTELHSDQIARGLGGEHIEVFPVNKRILWVILYLLRAVQRLIFYAIGIQ